MTTYNKTSLKTFFEQGDVPTGTDYANLIDSCVNMVETVVQSMAGALNPTELIAAQVSAGAAVFTGAVRIGGVTSAADINSTGTITAATVNTTSFVTTNITVTSANVNGNLLVTGNVSADTIAASAARFSTGIVSAAGTTQGAAAALIYTVNLGAGVVDGATTGFLLPANQRGRIQFLTNGAASANLWPPTGGQINALASNAAFGMTASTLYTIVHTLASGYAVK